MPIFGRNFEKVYLPNYGSTLSDKLSACRWRPTGNICEEGDYFGSKKRLSTGQLTKYLIYV